MTGETIRIMSDGLSCCDYFPIFHDLCLHILNSLCPSLNLNPVFQTDGIRRDPVHMIDIDNMTPSGKLLRIFFVPSILLYSVPCPHSLLSQELPPSQSCHQSLPNMSYGSGSSPDLLLQQLLQVCDQALRYILSH